MTECVPLRRPETLSIRRRLLAAATAGAVALVGGGCASRPIQSAEPPVSGTHSTLADCKRLPDQPTVPIARLKGCLDVLPDKGRAPKTGYSRDQFGHGWRESDGCDTRDRILRRDLQPETLDKTGCKVLSGHLQDPYTGKLIDFRRGAATSDEVQIDHLVALGDAWQTGAQQLTASAREQLANDPLNLQSTDGPTNEAKGDADAASWLPPNEAYRCQYVGRQVLVKLRYDLWITPPEDAAIQQVLSGCDDDRLPVGKLQAVS